MNEEGFLFGLKLKTKIYRREVLSLRDSDSDSIAGGEDDDNYDDNVIMCSICIIELEDGETIADLNCNHCFHADCLSEWIKKKVGILWKVTALFVYIIHVLILIDTFYILHSTS